ncbi:MAG: toxin-antitoxin system HicB family antitoxin [Acidobacteria bacterium]|nr:toxin-antitoxin system HicB family antitoxin [Acidobacteriota bacterium]
MVRTRDIASGRFILRIDAGLHARLREAAAAAGFSLNEYCARKLEAPASEPVVAAAEVIRNARRVAGDALLGVAAFGSWARGELADTSDVDLLLVLDSTRPVDRDLYREWDREPLSWDGHPIEPHFVRLPEEGAVSSVWAEVAIGGIVLFERGLAVSKALITIRERIAEGKIVRRLIHGQPYWVEAA